MDLPPAVKQAVSAAAAAGVGAVVGGAAGAAGGYAVDINNRQLHPGDLVLAKKLADKAKSEGLPFSEKEIEEQLRLMGNGAYGVEPNHAEIYINTPISKTFRDLQAGISGDPGMPKGVREDTVYEVLGAPNSDIQRYILENSTDSTNWIPGKSPYVPSIKLPASSSEAKSPTVPCANSDANCKAGIGQTQNQPIVQLTPAQRQDAADYLGQAGTNYQRIALLAASAGKPDIALAYEIAAASANAMEQLMRPSAGKASLDIATDMAIDAVSRQTGVPKSVLFEIAERQVKPLMAPIVQRIVHQ
jgi:filamentous hemagglutinin